MREAEPDWVDDTATIEVVEVGEVAAPGAEPLRHRVVDRAAPRRHRLSRIIRQRDVLQTLASGFRESRSMTGFVY
jgi:hypothetical protein